MIHGDPCPECGGTDYVCEHEYIKLEMAAQRAYGALRMINSMIPTMQVYGAMLELEVALAGDLVKKSGDCDT